MKKRQDIKGFSIIEVLMAIGVLAVGMLFVAGVFPVGIYFATITAERTTAAIISDEAFAKIKLYGVDVSDLEYENCVDFNDVVVETIAESEFRYPSTDIKGGKRYCWSAICRSVDASNPELVQVTVFISRKMGAGSKYPKVGGGTADYPQPYKIGIDTETTGVTNEIEITNDAEKTYINNGSRIVDDKTGVIYRVLERYASDDAAVILLDKAWTGDAVGSVWVVPPPVGGGRYPCIAVYQRVIRF